MTPVLHCTFKFLSTVPQRERPFKVTIDFLIPVISIHAPARGATYVKNVFGNSPDISIHAPARGATVNAYCMIWTLRIFLSTLPQGERLLDNEGLICYVIFLSTLPQGERPLSGLGRVIRVIFLSTLPQGERPFCKAIFPKPIKFLSTLPQGERRVLRIQ